MTRNDDDDDDNHNNLQQLQLLPLASYWPMTVSVLNVHVGTAHLRRCWLAQDGGTVLLRRQQLD
jgi:hypothetical protein